MARLLIAAVFSLTVCVANLNIIMKAAMGKPTVEIAVVICVDSSVI